MRRGQVLSRFCVKAGFFPSEEADRILARYEGAPESAKLTFEAWAVAKGLLGVVQARGAVEMLANSRFRCLGCGAELFGRQFRIDGQKMFCPHCNGEEFRIQGAAGVSGESPRSSNSKAPKPPSLGTADPSALPDSFEDFEDDAFGGADNLPAIPGGAFPAPAGNANPFGSTVPPPPPPPAMATPGGTRRDIEITPAMLDRGLPEGSILEGIRITKVVGRGGIGIVYKGVQQQLEREVALKVLSANVLKDAVQRSRFQLEAKSSARLEHPNIVQVYTFGEKFGRPYLVMQWIDGESLGQKIDARGALPVVDVVEWGIQAARGLHHAHQSDIVHRDVKPDNLIISTQGVLKIVDFGLAKQKQSDLNLSDPNFVLGTPAYIAPEQALGQPIDPRTDVYSLAITLYHALTGDIPFDGPAGTVVHKHIQATLPSPRAKNPAVPEDLDALVRKMAAKVPNQRPKNMLEVAGALEQIRDRLRNNATQGAMKQATLSDLVDRVFDEDDGGLTDVIKKKPGARPGDGDVLQSGKATRQGPATSFKPIEEIEYVSGGSSDAVDTSAVRKPNTRQAAQPKPAAPVGELKPQGMQGRRDGAGAATAAPPAAAATSATPAPSAAPSTAGSAARRAAEGSADDVAQILGKDYATRVTKLGGETGETKKRSRKLLIVVILLMLVGSGVAGLVIGMPELFNPALGELKKLEARATVASVEKAEELRELRTAVDEFVLLNPSMESNDRYQKLDANVSALIKKLDRLDAIREMGRVVGILKTNSASLNDALLALQPFAADPGKINPSEHGRRLSFLERDCGACNEKLESAKQFAEAHDNLLTQEFRDALDGLATLIGQVTTFAEEFRARIDERKQQDELRLTILSDVRDTKWGSVDDENQPLPDQLPDDFDLDIAESLARRIREAGTRIEWMTRDQKLIRAAAILTALIRLRQKDMNVRELLDSLTPLNAEQQIERLDALREDRPELYADTRVQELKQRAEMAVDAIRGRFADLQQRASALRDPSRADDARKMVTEMNAFLSEALTTQRPAIKQICDELAALIVKDDANKATFQAFEERFEKLKTKADADALEKDVMNFGKAVPYFKRKCEVLADRVHRAGDNIEATRHNLEMVDAELKRWTHVSEPREASDALRSIEVFLSNPVLAEYRPKFEPMIATLKELIAWATLVDSGTVVEPGPKFGFPWQVMDISDPMVRDNALLQLQSVIGQYAAPAHPGAITGVRYSSDGLLMLTTGADGFCRIWNPATGHEVRAFRAGDASTPVFARFVNNNAWVVIAGGDQVRLFDLAQRKLVWSFGGHSNVLDIDVSPDAAWLATCCADGSVRIWDLIRKKQTPDFSYSHSGPVMAVSFSPSTVEQWTAHENAKAQVLLSGGTDGEARAYSFTNKSITTFRDGDSRSAITDIVAQANGQRFVTGHDDGRSVVWSTFGGTRQREQNSGGMAKVAVRSVAINGDTVASGTADGKVVIWNITNGVVAGGIDVGLGAVTALAFHNGGQQVIVGTERGLMRRFTVSGQSDDPRINAHTAAIVGMATVGKTHMATAADDGTVRVWKLADGRQYQLPFGMTRTEPVNVFAPDAARLVVVQRDGQVALFRADGDRYRLAGSIADTGVGRGASCAAISPDGKLLFIGSEERGSVSVVDLVTNQVQPALGGAHQSPISAVAAGPNGQFVASADTSGRVVLWEVVGPETKHVIEFGSKVECLAFTPDGLGLLVGGGTSGAGRTVRYRTLEGTEARTYQAASGRARVTAVLPLPDRLRVVICNADGLIHVCDLSSGNPVSQPLNLAGTRADRQTGDFVTRLRVDSTGRLLAGTARGVVLAFTIR